MKKMFCPLGMLTLLFSAGGCSLFREVIVSRHDSLQRSSRKLSLDWKVDSTYTAGRLFTYTDSGGAVFDVEIVPLGAFSFSPRTGFSGSASSVRIRGKSENKIRLADSSSRQQHVQLSGSLKAHAKSRVEKREKQVVKKGNNRLWWWGGLLVLCLIATIFLLRLRGRYAKFIRRQD